MTLYGDLISPYVRTCLVVAHELGFGRAIDLRPAEVQIGSVNETLAALSPIAQIPVLVTADGTVIHDSRVIIDYLCQLGRSTGLLPPGGAQRVHVLTLQAVGLGMADAAVAYRNEVMQRPPDLHWQAWLERQRRRIGMSLDALESRWTQALTDITAGTLTVAVALSYLDFRFAEWHWRDGRPRLSEAHTNICSRTSMIITQPEGP